MLAPAAVSELLRAAVEQRSDFVYADEYLLHTLSFSIRHKKDFDLKLLWHDNYINHPVLIQKSLYDEVGGFRSSFNGSQDYDLFLRLAEKTSKIVHVCQPLYVWRIHETSFSQTSLQCCIESGKKALEEHFARTGVKAEVIAQQDSAIFKIIVKTNENLF